MKINISTFQKINIIAIISGLTTFFIPVLIDTSNQSRLFYLFDLIASINFPSVSLLIVGLVAAIISTIMSFKSLLDLCIQYIAGILILTSSILLIFFFSFNLYYGFFLGYAPFTALISGMLIIANASTEIKDYNREDLILPKEIVLTSLWNLFARNILFQILPIGLFLFYYNIFVIIFILRSVLDVILIFGARSVKNQLKIGGFVCLISIVIMTLIEVWILIIIPKNLSLVFWVFPILLLGIPFLYQLYGGIKSFRESRE